MMYDENPPEPPDERARGDHLPRRQRIALRVWLRVLRWRWLTPITEL